jgi:hypothetical protein
MSCDAVVLSVAIAFCYISGFDPFSTPLVFCTYFYNHAHRVRILAMYRVNQNYGL